MVVTGTYSDTTTQVEEITAANVTGFNSSAVAESQTLTVTVDEKTATYDISIVKADGPAAIAENFAGAFPAAGTSINLTGLAADATGLEAAVAIDGTTYGDYANLTVDGSGIAVITGLTGVTSSTKVKVRVAETATNLAGAEKEISTPTVLSAVKTGTLTKDARPAAYQLYIVSVDSTPEDTLVYRMKPDGTINKLDVLPDEDGQLNIYQRVSDTVNPWTQQEGIHTFLIRKGDVWYESVITYDETEFLLERFNASQLRRTPDNQAMDVTGNLLIGYFDLGASPVYDEGPQDEIISLFWFDNYHYVDKFNFASIEAVASALSAVETEYAKIITTFQGTAGGYETNAEAVESYLSSALRLAKTSEGYNPATWLAQEISELAGFSASVTAGETGATIDEPLRTVVNGIAKDPSIDTLAEFITAFQAALATATQDNTDIATAKTNIEGATYTATQAEAGTEAAAATKAQALVDALELAGTTAVVVPGTFNAAVAGDSGTPAGTNGSYTFTVTIDKGLGTQVTSAEKTMAITATAYVAVDSTITPTTANFDKKTEAQADVEVTMTLNGNTLTAVKNGEAALTAETDYTVADSTVTIKKEYLATQAVGSLVLTLDFSAGADDSIVITISDSTPPPRIILSNGSPRELPKPWDQDVGNAGEGTNYYENLNGYSAFLYVIKLGSGEITNVNVELIGSDSEYFVIDQDSDKTWSTTLNDEYNYNTFRVYPANGLLRKIYTATVSITADDGTDKSFNVKFEIKKTQLKAKALLAESNQTHLRGFFLCAWNGSLSQSSNQQRSGAASWIYVPTDFNTKIKSPLRRLSSKKGLK